MLCLKIGLTFFGCRYTPKPIKGLLNIKLATAIAQYTLYNITGRNVLGASKLNNQQATINITNLPAGLYVLQLIDANKQISQQKIVLER